MKNEDTEVLTLIGKRSIDFFKKIIETYEEDDIVKNISITVAKEALLNVYERLMHEKESLMKDKILSINVQSLIVEELRSFANNLENHDPSATYPLYH